MACSLLLVVQTFSLCAQTNQSRLAVEARFDLYATTNVGPLQNLEIVNGLATLSRQTWMKPADQLRACSVTFPITHFNTNEVLLRFTPKESGRVTLSLLGPYERIPTEKEAIYQQEVLWDLIDLAGAALVPESAALLRPPVKSWFRQRYDLGILVQGGTPVTLRCMARAAIPDGYREAPPISDRDSLAHRSAKRYQRGVTLTLDGESLRSNATAALFTEEDFSAIRREGFDHVRLSVAWHLQSSAGPEFVLSKELFDKVDPWIAKAAAHDLGLVLGFCNFDAFYQNPSVELPRFVALWRQIASHYASQASFLAFELISPGSNRSQTTTLNAAYQEVLRGIRASDPDRTIFVSPGRLGNPSELTRFQLPPEDGHLIVSLHSRDPEPFTQQAVGGSVPGRLSGIRFPGPPEVAMNPESMTGLDLNVREWIGRYQTLPPDRNPSGASQLRGLVRFAQQWSAHTGRPVYFADWGCPQQLEPGSRARYYAAWRSALSDAGIGWGILDWKQSHRYWDEKSAQPMVGLREALFPGKAVAPPTSDTPEPLQNALKQIRDLKTQVHASEQQSVVAMKVIQARASEAQEEAARTQRMARWMMVGLIGMALLLLTAVMLRRRPTPAGMMLPVPTQPDAIPGPESFRQGTMTQLAQMLKSKLVVKLLEERRDTKTMHRRAADDLAEMEHRLELIQAPIADRLQAYERRIQELEQDLARKGEENRELIRAKIALAKERLELARLTGSSDWN